MAVDVALKSSSTSQSGTAPRETDDPDERPPQRLRCAIATEAMTKVPRPIVSNNRRDMHLENDSNIESSPPSFILASLENAGSGSKYVDIAEQVMAGTYSAMHKHAIFGGGLFR